MSRQRKLCRKVRSPRGDRRARRRLPDGHPGVRGHRRGRRRRCSSSGATPRPRPTPPPWPAAEDLFRNFPKNKGVDYNGTAQPRPGGRRDERLYQRRHEHRRDTCRSTADLSRRALQGPDRSQGHVEVSVQRNQPRYFSAVIGSGTMPVPARAVGRGKWEPAYVGIHVLDLHASSALRAQR